MKILVVFVAVISLCSAKSVRLLKETELTSDLVKDPRYLLWETEEGLYEVEDLHSNDTSDIVVSATEDDVSFYIYTPKNPLIGTRIRESQLHDLVELTGFNISRPTLVVIHGWKNHYESPVNDGIKNAALLVGDNINVIVADWSPIAERNYISAKGSVVAVGNYIGDFLLRMDDELGHRISELTIVGHSLGAHIAGNVGARTKGLIETIVGLDPAGPLFSKKNTDNRLDPTDAKYVQVIHTNDGMLGFGIDMGDVDYYPNGGRSQPGCGIDLIGSCAHGRAYEYFAESFTSNKFSAVLCDSYRNYEKNRCDGSTVSQMGGYPVLNAPHGNYYLKTNRDAPYAQG